MYGLIWVIRWSFFSQGKNRKYVGIRSKVVNRPTITSLNTNCYPNSIFLVDYYVQSLVIGYWDLSRLFSQQVALNSIVSGWLRNLPPRYHSEQIHSLNETSIPIRVRWDRSLGHSMNVNIPKRLNRENMLIWKWEKVAERFCELSRKFSEQI